MARSIADPSSFLAVAALLLCARLGAPAEVLVEVEGQVLNVGALGEEPGGAGADVSNALRLESLAPALNIGMDLGPTRRIELRLRRLRDDNVYATVHTDLLVLNGEQRVARDSLDALLAQKLGGTPFRLELGYRYLDLERSWEDAVGSGGDLRTLDYSSDVRGHGVRMALGLDLRFLGRLHLDAALGLEPPRGAGEPSRSLHRHERVRTGPAGSGLRWESQHIDVGCANSLARRRDLACLAGGRLPLRDVVLGRRFVGVLR